MNGEDAPRTARMPSAAPAPEPEPAPPSPKRRTWIAWETQRRSLNLSARLGAKLVLCLDEDRGWLRHLVSARRTLRVLRGQRGQIVFVQNPSMLLAALACLMKRRHGYFLVVDRHSNFDFLSPGKAGLKRRLADLLSGYTLRGADLTVVTNAELAARIEALGASAHVLADPFPETGVLPPAEAPRDGAARRIPEILFVSSWAFDEPIAETIEACRRLRGRAVVRITGKPKPGFARLLASAPGNFIPTGFVPDAEYFALMARCDAVMAVTRRPMTLVCGAYEAAALGKPMILGDSRALRAYFHLGAVYTDASAGDIEAKIESLLGELARYGGEVRLLRDLRAGEWERAFKALEARLPGP